MDAAFIRDNQIVERYLMGKLPLKGAQDFERWCRQHPELVAGLDMPERINAALRLLDATGEPLPWAEKPLAAWQKPAVFGAVAAVAALALVTAAALFFSGQNKADQIARLERQQREQPLQAVQATRNLTLEMSRNGPVAQSVAVIQEERALLADFRLDLSWSRYTSFLVTIDRVGQGRVAELSNLARDSNGHLRVALNSSLLGPGDYTITVEGLNMRRGTEAQAWSRFTVRR